MNYTYSNNHHVMKPFLLTILISCGAYATEFHVAPTGRDANRGSEAKPFRTISAAATVAQPGDVITGGGRGVTSPYSRIDAAVMVW